MFYTEITGWPFVHLGNTDFPSFIGFLLKIKSYLMFVFNYRYGVRTWSHLITMNLILQTLKPFLEDCCTNCEPDTILLNSAFVKENKSFPDKQQGFSVWLIIGSEHAFALTHSLNTVQRDTWEHIYWDILVTLFKREELRSGQKVMIFVTGLL